MEIAKVTHAAIKDEPPETLFSLFKREPNEKKNGEPTFYIFKLEYTIYMTVIFDGRHCVRVLL